MHITKNKLGYIRSAFAFVLAAAMTFSSVFNVAAVMSTNSSTKEQRSNPVVVEMANGDIITARIGTKGFTTDIIKANEITVDCFGKKQKYYMAKGTVADVLERANITLKENQVVSPSMSTKLDSDMTVSVYNGKKIFVTADGSTKTVYAAKGKTADVLNDLGYKISDDDILSVARDSEIWNINSVTIQRVTYAEEKSIESVAFKSVNEPSDKIELGETKLKTNGKNGEKIVTKRCKYIDGKKKASKVIASKIIKNPVDKVTLVGTKGASTNGGAGTFKDMYGNTIAYKSVHTGSGTAYTAPAGACTATGVPAYHGGVAVNPNIIPYGSKLYIASTDGSVVYGYATAVDTGGALMDGSALVDCFYNTYDECINFGRRNVNVYVIS